MRAGRVVVLWAADSKVECGEEEEGDGGAEHVRWWLLRFGGVCGHDLVSTGGAGGDEDGQWCVDLQYMYPFAQSDRRQWREVVPSGLWRMSKAQ